MVPLIGGKNGWDKDELVNKRVHVIAKAHSCSIDDVHAALDRRPIELNRDAYLKRTLSLELIRCARDGLREQGSQEQGRSGWC
jgi:hypothetical protein